MDRLLTWASAVAILLVYAPGAASADRYDRAWRPLISVHGGVTTLVNGGSSELCCTEDDDWQLLSSAVGFQIGHELGRWVRLDFRFSYSVDHGLDRNDRPFELEWITLTPSPQLVIPFRSVGLALRTGTELALMLTRLEHRSGYRLEMLGVGQRLGLSVQLHDQLDLEIDAVATWFPLSFYEITGFVALSWRPQLW